MEKEKVYSSPYEFEGKIPLKQAIPLGLQHVLAMLVAGIVTLVQLFAIGPCGGKVPIIMGTSSGFIGVFNSVVNVMGGGILAYGAIMGASIIGGLFEGVLGFMLKPLRKFFPAVVTGTVVLSIGLSLISVGVGYGLGANAAALAGLPQGIQLIFGGSGIVPACIVAILMNVLLPKEKEA